MGLAERVTVLGVHPKQNEGVTPESSPASIDADPESIVEPFAPVMTKFKLVYVGGEETLMLHEPAEQGAVVVVPA